MATTLTFSEEDHEQQEVLNAYEEQKAHWAKRQLELAESQNLPSAHHRTWFGKKCRRDREFDDVAAQRFLIAYSQTGRLHDSCTAAGVNYFTMNDWRSKDERFDILCEEARGLFVNILEREMFRRGVEGVEEPVWQKGEYMGTITRYSDKLLEMLAKRHAPADYGNKIDANVNISGGVLVAPAGITEANTPLQILDEEDDDEEMIIDGI